MRRSEALNLLKKDTDSYLSNPLTMDEVSLILTCCETIIGMEPPVQDKLLGFRGWDQEDPEALYYFLRRLNGGKEAFDMDQVNDILNFIEKRNK